MFPIKKYNNFVKASKPVDEICEQTCSSQISGEVAKRIYLEEVKEAASCVLSTEGHTSNIDRRKHHLKRRKEKLQITNKELFVAIQENDIQTVKQVLEEFPEKLHVVDGFGWSLLMIACQANSVEIVKDLLDRGIDTSIRDKAGNSAQSLVIKNKNFKIATILLDSKSKEKKLKQNVINKSKSQDEYKCEICNNIFIDMDQHLSSTIHNINVSKDKKIPPCYRIPESNRGFQIMLKTGWDKGSGLGSHGSGIKYPIKPVQKKDRKGLGHEKPKHVDIEENVSVRLKNKKLLEKELWRSRSMEVNFRREFY